MCHHHRKNISCEGWLFKNKIFGLSSNELKQMPLINLYKLICQPMKFTAYAKGSENNPVLHKAITNHFFKQKDTIGRNTF